MNSVAGEIFRLASAIRCRSLLGLRIADRNNAVSGCDTRKTASLEIAAADGLEQHLLAANTGRGQHIGDIGIVIGVIALPDLGFFQRTTANDDAAIDRGAVRRGKGRREDAEGRTRLRLEMRRAQRPSRRPAGRAASSRSS